MDEPLLQEQDEAAEQAPVGAKDVPLPVKNEQEEALDQEELKLFWYDPHIMHFCVPTPLSSEDTCLYITHRIRRRVVHSTLLRGCFRITGRASGLNYL